MNACLAEQVANVLADPIFASRISAVRCSGSLQGPLDYAIAVPVRDEEALLPRALNALLATMRAVPSKGGLVFVVNDTVDRSASIIRQRLQDANVSFALVEISFAQDIRNAPHARRLALDLAFRYAPEGVLLTTDADSHVGQGWVASRLARIASGYDLVCEDVRLDEAELALLPAHVAAVGEAERAYFEVSNRLWHSWTQDPIRSFAYRASGASLAIRSGVYRALGGLPTPSIGEDAALCDAVLAEGLHVCMANGGETRTSARLRSRAQGGCGACLASRALEENPLCDPALVPLAVLREWAAVASRFPQEDRLAALARLRNSMTARPLSYAEVLEELDKARLAEQELALVDA